MYLYTRRNVKARWKICWGKTPRVEIRVMWPTAGKTVRTRLLKPPWSSHTALAAGHEVKRISPLPWLGFGLAMAWLFLPLTPHCFLHALYYQLFLSASFLFFFTSVASWNFFFGSEDNLLQTAKSGSSLSVTPYEAHRHPI